METVKLSSLFDISYGNRLDLNKMEIVDEFRGDSVNFVSRTSKNLGVVAVVRKIEDEKEYESGTITVALGGSVLSSFVQPRPYYTAQNIMVLTPKKDMTLQEKIYYCTCIRKNAFRYSTFGREANRTLDKLELPATAPKWVNTLNIPDQSDFCKPINTNQQLVLDTKNWKEFRYDYLFDIQKGKRITNLQMKNGTVPCIRPIDSNNGVYKFIDIKPNHKGNTITVNYNGSVGEAFYQPIDYFALDDVNVLYPKFELNSFIALFLVTLIRKERYRFNYGRKWKLERMNESMIKLPVNDLGEPDFKFMENFIKSLPYSSSL